MRLILERIIASGIALLFLSLVALIVSDILFRQMLSRSDPAMLQRAFGSETYGRTTRKLWRFMLRRAYSEVGDRRTLLLGDLWRLSAVLFYVTFVAVVAAFIAHFWVTLGVAP